MADAELTISANITGLREQLASIPGITAQQARAMAAELNKSIQESARQAKRAASETERAYQQMGSAGAQSMARASSAANDATVATERFSDRVAQQGTNISKVSGALDLVSPKLGGVARGFADIADFMEVATMQNSAYLGPIAAVTTAVVTLGGVLSYHETKLQRQIELQQLNAETARQAVPAVYSIQQATVDYDVAVGKLSESQGEVQKAYIREQQAAEEYRFELEKELEVINKQIETNRRWEQSLEFLLGRAGKGIFGLAQSLGIAGESTEHLTNKTEALTKRYQNNLRLGTEQTTAAEDLIKAREEERQKAEDAAAAERRRAERQAKADRARAEAARRRAEAEAAALKAAREAEEAERAREQAIMDVLKLNIEYADGIHSLTQAAKLNLTEEEKILDEGAERLRQLNELAIRTEYLATTTEQAAQARAQAEVSRAAIEANTEHQLAELREKLRNEELEAEQEASDEATKIREQRMQQFLDIAGYVSEGFGMVSSGLDDAVDNSLSKLDRLEAQYADLQDTMTEEERQATKKRIEAQRAAALRAFEIQKVGKLAEATVGGAAAVVQALASAPPPLNVIAAATTAAAVAGQLAAIASAQPAFHSGGMVPNSAAPDEVPARLITGEAVLSRTGRNMIGDDQINRANAGMSQPVQVVAVQQYRHRVYNDFVRDNLRLGGSLADAIRGSRTVGMREAV